MAQACGGDNNKQRTAGTACLLVHEDEKDDKAD
jgi:hypothetical protein